MEDTRRSKSEPKNYADVEAAHNIQRYEVADRFSGLDTHYWHLQETRVQRCTKLWGTPTAW